MLRFLTHLHFLHICPPTLHRRNYNCNTRASACGAHSSGTCTHQQGMHLVMAEARRGTNARQSGKPCEYLVIEAAE